MHERDWRQQCVVAWGSQAFGADSATSPTERTLRFGEEALELLQARGVDRDAVHMLVDYVFDRPVGQTEQEIGGTSITLLALCEALGFSAEDLERREFLRCIGKDPAHFRRRNEEKKRDGVTTLVAAE